MSFDAFLKHKGVSVKTARREEACHFLKQHGTVYSMMDYLWYTDRTAFWEAISSTKIAADLSNSLKTRCQAVQKARSHWRQFLVSVEPYEPCVPPLPACF